MNPIDQNHAQAKRRWIATVLVALMAGSGLILTAQPASAGPCDAFATGEWLGSWATDNVSESGGVARFDMAFSGTSVTGTLQFAAGQTTLGGGDAIVGTRALGSCSFSAVVGGLVTIEGTVAPSEQEMSGAWAYAGFSGSWHGGRVTDSASDPNTTLLTTDETASGVSAADPVATTVSSPVSGPITIDEAISSVGSVSGYSILGTVVRVTAPTGTLAAPLMLTFDLDSSVNGTAVTGTVPAASLAIFRNGVEVPGCASQTLPITVDPCVWERTDVDPPSGDVRLIVATTQASTWFMGVKKGSELRIVSDELLSAKLGVPYTKALTANNIVGAAKWKKVTKLPKGLKLAAKTGVISGTPKKLSGTFTFKVALIDKVKVKGSPATKTIVEKVFMLTIKP